MSIEKESELEREPTREECVAWLEFAGTSYVEELIPGPTLNSWLRACAAFLRAPALVLSERELSMLRQAADLADLNDTPNLAATLRAIASRGKL